MGKFKRLVESKEGMEKFRAKYGIPPTVGMGYVAQGEWVDARKTGEVVISIIAFIEGGMTIPMDTITRNYLRFFRLSPTPCAPNMFRVLRSIEALNERMNLNLPIMMWIGYTTYIIWRDKDITLSQGIPK